MAKRQRVHLGMSDDYPVKDLKDFKEYFDWEKALQYYKSGELVKWLRERYYDEEADALEKMDDQSGTFPKEFCALFGVEYSSEKTYIPPSSPRMRSTAGQRRKAPAPPPRPVAMPRPAPTTPSTPVVSSVADGADDEMDFDFGEAFFGEAFEEKEVDTSPQKETPDELYQKGVDAYNRTDYTAALEYFQKAANLGNVAAMNNVGAFYDNGYGTTKNYQEAMNWYKKAAELGDEMAMNNVGALYENGRGVTQNYQEAMKWYLKAANAGYTDAMFDIGLFYANGQGVTQNYREAMKWYKRAADYGNAGAMNNIGFLYSHGQGVAQDYQEAMRWYKKAADLGRKMAMYNVGSLYENGQGVERNYQEALNWYIKAFDAGLSDAKEKIESVKQKISKSSSIGIFNWFK